MSQRKAGIIQVSLNGVLQDAKGAFTYNLGKPIRKAIVGSDGVHGYTEEPQVAFVEGAFTDRGSLDLEALVTMEGALVTVNLANQKVIVLRDAWYAGEGSATTEEGEIVIRFEGKSAQEIAA